MCKLCQSSWSMVACQWQSHGVKMEFQSQDRHISRTGNNYILLFVRVGPTGTWSLVLWHSWPQLKVRWWLEPPLHYLPNHAIPWMRQNAAVADKFVGLKLQLKNITTSQVTLSDVPPNTILWRGNPMRTISSRPNRNRWTFNASHFPFGLISTYLANMFLYTCPKKSLSLNWDRENFNPVWGQCVKHGIATAESEINGICCRLWLVLAKTTFGWAAVRIDMAFDRKPHGLEKIWVNMQEYKQWIIISQNWNGLHLATSGDALCSFWEIVHKGGAGHGNIHLAKPYMNITRVRIVEVTKLDDSMILMIWRNRLGMYGNRLDMYGGTHIFRNRLGMYGDPIPCNNRRCLTFRCVDTMMPDPLCTPVQLPQKHWLDVVVGS